MIKEKIIDLLYPPVCPMCGRIICKNELCCKLCQADITYLHEPRCYRCGREIEDEECEYCDDCTKKVRSYIMGFPAVSYEGKIRDSLAALKYGNKKSFSKFFAMLIASTEGERIGNLGVEALVPVPIHKKKLKKRGYNQAKLIADDLSGILNIPVDDTLIKRSINTLPMKKLDDVQREQNLKRAFIFEPKSVKYNKVMLVDDIYTTGATIEACTKALHGLGIRDVYYTSVCIGKGF